MRKRRVYLVVVGVVVLLGAAIAVLAPEEREPEYQGKMLREWVDVYDSSNGRQGADAIRAIGKSALPFLLRWTAYETPRWEQKVNSVLEKISAGHLGLSLEPDMAPSAAARAFRALGPEAETAIPGLTRLLYGRSRGDSADNAAYALVSIGPRGMPPLLAALSNTQSRVTARIAAATYLPFGETNAVVLVPIFTRLLVDPEFRVRDRASNVLMIATNQPIYLEWY